LNFNADLLFMNLLNVINLIIATPEELSLYFLGAALGEYQAARIHTLSWQPPLIGLPQDSLSTQGRPTFWIWLLGIEWDEIW
jgi:hypothetical protein